MFSTPAEQPDYRYFNLQGTHGEVGYLLGSLDSPFSMQPWWAPPADLVFTRECAAVVRAIHPDIMEEFTGYADAQSWDMDLMWQQNCRVNLKARFRLGAEGCSTFAWYTGEYAIVGRNYDYWPMQIRRQRIRFAPATSGHATIGARGGVPCGRYDGINEYGLWVSLHVVMTDTPSEVKPGIPFHLVVRLALELCSSAREAVDFLQRIPHLSSLNYLVADVQEAFVVEADPRRVRALPMLSSAIAATNHYRHPDMVPLQGNRVLTNSTCRVQKLTILPENYKSSTDIETLLMPAKHVLADRTVPICGLSGSLTTLWSCVAELTTGRIQYAPGAPTNTPYEDIPGLRGKQNRIPDLRRSQ